MSDTEKRRPAQTSRAGGLQVAVWECVVEGKSGHFLSHSVTFRRSYWDPDTKNWIDSSTFFPDDLPRLRLLLEKAYEHIVLRGAGAGRETTNADAADTAVA